MTEARLGDWLQMHSGRPFWPLDPRPEDIDITEIAHALSLLCRFGGHCARFYSVAEHSVHVSRLVPAEHRLTALLHDATEAYLVDIPRPLKRMLPMYEELETRVWAAIAAHYGLPPEMPVEVKAADNAMLAAEAIALMAPPPMPWSDQAEPAPIQPLCLGPVFAKDMFLHEFAKLRGRG